MPKLNVGENVEVEETKDEIVIRLRKDYRGGLSASGKTVRVATTGGNQKLPSGITIGLNAYVKPDQK